MTDRQLDIITARVQNAKNWKAGLITWDEIKGWMANPANRKVCGNYVLGAFRDGLRSNATAISRSSISMDADSPTKGFLAAVRDLGVETIVHTTYSSAPDEPRYRVLILTDKDMHPDEYVHITERIMDRTGRENWDKGSREPARYMFKPSTQEPGWFTFKLFEGPPLDVEEWLADFDEDLSKLPMPGVNTGKRDPFEIEGTIGAFNRAYQDLADLVATYDLPYEPTGDRWQLAGSRSVAGMGEVRAGLFWSHHTTDPAYGQMCSAFDLVRLHRFGAMDLDAPPKTPVNRLPSHEAMLEVASKDIRVVKELVGDDFMDELRDESWKLKLSLTPRTGQIKDTIANWDIIRDNDEAFQGLRFNEFTMQVESDVDFPWRPLTRGGPTFTTVDLAALCHYIEREYSIRPSRTFIDEIVRTTAQRRHHNPVRGYLEKLTWDGRERMEVSLPGVNPTPYTRMVARKVLVAAVARIFEPGCKWDHTLVLAGDEGLGKTWWVERMARGHMANLGPIHDKDTLLTMQRSWIMLADESYSLRKADADSLKEFLTRTYDVFRAPFERETIAHPRHCVIWSSTNDEVFLRRQAGNRRFLVVTCEERVDFDLYTDDYIAQIWAEAVAAYQAGERLYLDEEEGLVAASQREAHTEEDALAGTIQHYLDTLVPEDWETLSPASRFEWLTNRADDLVPPGTVQITEVCSTQIWREALGQYVPARRTDLLDITNSLKSIPGWAAVPGRKRLPHYGPQMVFRRVDAVTDDDPSDIL